MAVQREGGRVSQASSQRRVNSKDTAATASFLLPPKQQMRQMQPCEMSSFPFFLSVMQIFLNQFRWGFIFSGYRNTRRTTAIRLTPLLIIHADPHGRGYCDRSTNNKVGNSQVANPSNFLIL